MISLLLSLAMAQDVTYGPELPPAADTQFERLFADGAPAASAEVEPSVPTWMWPLGLGAAGIAGAFQLRRRGNVPRLENLRVLHRTTLGDRSALLLVEVADAHGGRRRLLIGTGAGAPALVADLGDLPEAESFDRVIAAAQAPATVVEEVLAERVSEPPPVRTAPELPPVQLHPVPQARLDVAIGDDTLSDAFFGETKPARRRYFTEEDLAPIPMTRTPRMEPLEVRSSPGRIVMPVAPAARAMPEPEPEPIEVAPARPEPARVAVPREEPVRASLKDILTRAAATDAQRRPAHPRENSVFARPPARAVPLQVAR